MALPNSGRKWSWAQPPPIWDQGDFTVGVELGEIGVLVGFAVDRDRHALVDLAGKAGKAAVERLRHGGATALRRGELLQSLAQLDGVDPAFPIFDKGIGVQRYPFKDCLLIARRQLARDDARSRADS
jgi:hypothetical protein